MSLLMERACLNDRTGGVEVVGASSGGTDEVRLLERQSDGLGLDATGCGQIGVSFRAVDGTRRKLRKEGLMLSMADWPSAARSRIDGRSQVSPRASSR